MLGDTSFEVLCQNELAAENLEDNEVSAAKLEIPTAFEVLYQRNTWICNTGASGHSANSRLGAYNKRDSGSASIGHAGEALEKTVTID